MKNILVIICFYLFCSSAHAQRIAMEQMPEDSKGHEEIIQLMSDLSSSCNSKEFNSFILCFTKKRGAVIKNKMKNIFDKHNLEMNIISVEVVESGKKEIKFDLEYEFNDKAAMQRQIISSSVLAKFESNKWRIDKEDIKSSKNDWRDDSENLAQIDNDLPLDIDRHNFGACANGRCQINMNFKNAATEEEEDGLPSDIERQK